jgi:hypothetical protein
VYHTLRQKSSSFLKIFLTKLLTNLTICVIILVCIIIQHYCCPHSQSLLQAAKLRSQPKHFRAKSLRKEQHMSLEYTWSDKSKACSLYMTNGNMRTVSEVMDVPYSTLCDWKNSDWWQQLVEEIRNAKRAKTGTKLSTIIDTSLEVVLDRLQHGDYILNNKTGKIERRKVSLRDAATVTNNLITRQLQMEELADKMETNKATVQDTLAMLAKEFQKMNKQKVKALATDIDYKELPDAIHEEREEGL